MRSTGEELISVHLTHSSHILFILGISWSIKLMPEEVYPPDEDSCLQKQAGTVEEAFFRLDRVAA